MRITLPTVLLSLCLLAAVLPLHALDEIYKLGDYETPHTRWLSPTPLEKRPRVLIFTSYRAGSGRYTRELADRFDLEYAHVLTHGGKIIGDNTGAARLEDLLVEPWDAFVFFEDGPTKLLSSYPKLYAILLFQIARDGAGIVMVDYDDDKVLKEKNRLPVPEIFQRLPASDDGLAACFYKVAKGRGVQLQGFDMPSPKWRKRYGYSRSQETLVIDYREGWREDYDAMFRQIGTALLWTIGQELPPFEVRIDGKNASVSGRWPDKAGLDFYVTGGGDRYDLKVGAAPTAGQRELSASLPDLTPGTYRLTALVRQGGRAYSYAVRKFEVARQPGHAIAGIVFDGGRYAGKLGETIRGQVSYTGDGVVTLRLRDSGRRILSAETLKGAGGVAPFSFRLKDWMPAMITVEAWLTKDGKNLDRRYEYCNKIIRRPRMFEFSAWGDARTHNSIHDLDRRLAELGLTSLMRPGYQMRHSPWGMQDFQLNSAHVYNTIPGTNPNNCFFSEKRRKSQTDRFKKYEPCYNCGMKFISLGDEVQEHYGCFAPDCLRRYREFLRKKYKGDLAHLNRNWKTAYQSWDEVTLSWIPEKNQGRDLEKYMAGFAGDFQHCIGNHLWPRYVPWGKKTGGFSFVTRTYGKIPAARKFWNDMFMDQEAGSFLTGNYPRWMDRQDFKSYAYSENNRFLKEYFQKIDPYIMAGMEGTGSIDYISHADRMADTQAWMGNYAESHHNNKLNEVHRSITSEDYVTDSWVGYITSPSMLCDRVWLEMMRRPALIMFYTTIGLGMPQFYGIVRPDFSVHTAAGEMLRETEKLRAGLGTSLMRSRSVNDPVALMYSYPSGAYGARVYHGDSFDTCKLSHNAIINWTMALGYSFRYVTGDRLDNGVDSLDAYKVLFLPRSCALSDRQVQLIEQFVRRGGSVIADVQPGVMDDFLVPRAPSPLDKVAGIQRGPFQPAKVGTLKIGDLSFRAQIDPAVKATAAHAHWTSDNGLPVVLVNHYGQGRFVTLNFPFQNLPAPEKTPAALMEVIRTATSAITSNPRFTMPGSETPYLCLQHRIWQNGDMSVMAVKSTPRGTLRVHAQLPGERYVYYLDEGRDLGRVSSFDFDMLPPKPEFFVLTDRPLPAVEAKVPSVVHRGQSFTVSYRVHGMKGERPLQLSYERDGQPVELYNKREVSAGPQWQTAGFRVAVDEKSGQYTLRVRDIYTGKITRHALTIHP